MSNPLIKRYRFSCLRPRHIWSYVFVYAVVTALILLLNIASYMSPHGYSTANELFQSLFIQFLAFEIVILCFWGGYNCGSAIRNEMLAKSYDFFKLLPLPEWKKSTGILIGTNLHTLIFGGLTLPLLLLFGICADYSLNFLAQTTLAMLCIALAVWNVSLLGSIRPDVVRRRTGPLAALFLGAFIGMPLMFSLLGMAAKGRLHMESLGFYTAGVPVLIFVSLFCVYIAAWAFLGQLRKFRRETDPLFTPRGAVGFLIGGILIAAGLVWQPETWAVGALSGYLSATLALLYLLPGGALRTFQAYLEKGSIAGRVARDSNVALGLILIAIWLVALLGMNLRVDDGVYTSLALCGLASFPLFALLLLETTILMRPIYPKVGLITGLIFILSLILPPIAAAVVGEGSVTIFSVFGYIGYMLADDAVPQHAAAVTLNIVLCIFPA